MAQTTITFTSNLYTFSVADGAVAKFAIDSSNLKMGSYVKAQKLVGSTYGPITEYREDGKRRSDQMDDTHTTISFYGPCDLRLDNSAGLNKDGTYATVIQYS